MNTLPIDLENIVYNYEHQLRMKDVMEELLNIFPKLHFECGVCICEGISFKNIKCSECKKSVICEYCIQEDIEDQIMDYRNCGDNYIPSDVNKEEHFRDVVINTNVCNDCHHERIIDWRTPFENHIIGMFNYDMEEMTRDL